MPLAALALVIGTLGANAQQLPPAKPAAPQTAATTDDGLERIVVTDVPIDDQILPTIRPISSGVGTETNVLDTPRSVSTITKGQLEARQIDSVNELGQYSSGTYSPSIFGAEGLPTIRGVLAELYQNGQREKYYRNSFPPSFNGVEALDIVKGPGTPIFGPSNAGPGGLVNFVTKQPFFDGQHTTVSLLVGDYVPGGDSYGHFEWGIDNGGPLIKDKLAYRISYFGREDDTYYRNSVNDVQDIFAALTYMPYKNLKFDLTGQFYESRFDENVGINRVTQDLIDNYRYISGPGVVRNPFIPGAVPRPPDAGTPPYFIVVDPGAGGSYNDQTQKVYPKDNLSSPIDSSYGHRFLGQLITTYDVNDSIKIINRNYGETVSTRKYSAYGYDEYSPKNIVYDTRTEFLWNSEYNLGGGSAPASKDSKDAKDAKTVIPASSDPFTIKNSFATGFSFRFEDNENYQDFSNEPFAYYDLKQKGVFATLPRSVVFGGQLVPDDSGYTAATFSNQSVASHYYDGGLFIQDQVQFGKHWTLFLGLRGDIIAVDSHQPALGPSLDGSIPASPAKLYADTKVFNPGYFGSITYKPTENTTAYFSYNRTYAMRGSDNFGAVPINVDDKQLRDIAELYETGLKGSFLKNTLYASAAYFWQTRDQRDINGNQQLVYAHGIELESTYQPNKNLSASANFTYADYKYKNVTGIYAQTLNYLDKFEAGVPVDGTTGTGVGSPNYGTIPVGGFSTEVPDIPSLLFNAYVTYQFDFGLGISIGPQVTGQVNLNSAGTLVIPAQVTWNGDIFYKRKQFEVHLAVFNFTDERNWTPTQAFGNTDLVYFDKPLNANLSVKVHF